MAAPSAQPSSPEPTLFAPSPLVVGDEARLALTFPDGTEAVIAYPGHLGLAEMGVQPDVDLRWDDRWVGAIVFSRGGPDDRLLNNRVAVHRAEVPPVEEWTAHNRGGRHQSTTRWLVFRLPSWTVHVPLGEPMEAKDVLGHVRPYETEEGFVAVQVTEPVELGEGYGEAGGPQLSFGDSHPLPDFVGPGPDGLLVDVAPAICRHFTIQVHGSYGSACLSDGSFFVNGTDFSDSDETQQKLVEVIEGIRVLELEPAS